ncbi:helix-turn-helix domain-containing protein [Phascolarctobacterium faecium]|jgi:transcriptional regulator with XRE-family HTH domain|uniref:helix-turn-helix domain-containing protein n=1 Tax=Phascolarctobacterium faecium TaxID=33025 RepID=UPI002671A6EA|nr:helix-turn-helix transcriptional regulator [Phascolarctobacterium faecium]
MNIYIEFGRRLAFIRQNSKLSQSQIAQKLNIAQSTYAGYEKGVRKIPLEIIVQLSKILNISPTILILGDEANIVKDYTISEQELIKKYRQLTAEQQGAIENSIDYYIKANKKDETTENGEDPFENKVG